MPRIPEAIIDEILEKTDFISFYKEKVRLTRKGNKWWGLCPFHTERTPSFSVDAERGLYYCFGCQKGGSLIDFVMELEKVDFPEAIEELAQRAHITLPEFDRTDERQVSDRAQLITLNEKLAGAFNWLLLKHPSGKQALEILNKRKITSSLIEKFRLGYAPADTSWLFTFLTAKGYSAEFLSKSGLFASKNPRYPLFANRIIFPIADVKGQIIAFGGRLINGDGPKYINSPDTMIFHKQENLFALDKALPSIRSTNQVLICEGYMDALAFHAVGISYAVAPLGTAFTTKQAHLLRKKCENVLLCFDSDEAGNKASERACSIAAEAGLSTSVVPMTEGKDASEILEKFGAETLKKTPEYSINSGDFLLKRAEGLFDFGTLEGKSKASAYFYPFLDALDSEVKRDTFLEFVGRRMGLSSSSLRADYDKAKAFGTTSYENDAQSKVLQRRNVTGARTADLLFMTAVMLEPDSFIKVKQSIRCDDLDDTRARDLYNALDEGMGQGAKETISLLAFSNDDAAKRFVTAVAASGELELGISKIIDDGIKAVRIRTLERSRMRLTASLGAISRDGNETTNMMDILKQKMQLDSELELLKGDVDE